ncbi:MAG: serine/threonine protein kinase [Polyangiaceae bacterium]|nr:serine/threonine protein kinase [Polyangiaceae bacterium]
MSDPASRVGTTVRNKWTLERLLGSGGMAAVYVGVHRIGRRDAIKILHPRAAKSREIRERFEREAHAANRFRHPGAVEIRDIDVTEDGAPFLVMELLAGESLADREIRLGRIELPEVLDYAAQILDTLAAAHAQDIVHRDIKPANLYVIEGGRVKVLDFGLARIRQDSAIQGELTRMGLVIGTTPYMPPEQAKGRGIDARADIFSVGATMFRLIAGRHVHRADSEFELLMKMANEPAPPLATMAPGAPRDVCLVVDRALAFDRDQRYPDAASMLEDVRAVIRGERPPHATARAGDADRGASTVPERRAPAPPAGEAPHVTWDPAPAKLSEDVHVTWGSSSTQPGEGTIHVELPPVSAAPVPSEGVHVTWDSSSTQPSEGTIHAAVVPGRGSGPATGADPGSIDVDPDPSTAGGAPSIPVEWSEGGMAAPAQRPAVNEQTQVSPRPPPPRRS